LTTYLTERLDSATGEEQARVGKKIRYDYPDISWG
jgi:hypothetical protein